MFEDLIREGDVAWAAKLMGLGPDGFAAVGDDDSRRRAMTRLDTVDFEACPGSGKTTLLVAKLAILASRWAHRQRGMCVLSHTNAARNEIGAKLNATAAGVALMRYPHFVGTIHSFVNEHLALPWLRSKGVEVRYIDTQIALAKRWALLPRNAKWALEQAGFTQSCMAYKQSDYCGSAIGRFGPLTPTYQAVVAARRASSEQGYFCYDEMFIWANELLDSFPETTRTLRERFPLVFIDEAQDNSEAQSALLHRIFCGGYAPSIRQRFGDSNQAIYANSNQSGAQTDPFPTGAVHPLPRSYRFGQLLADQVKGLGVVSQPLIGAGPPADLGVDPKAPAIFLFDDGSVERILPRYSEHLLETFDRAVLEAGVFTAVAGVHDLNGDDRIPRAMGHYLPSYDPAGSKKESVPTRFLQHLARARLGALRSGNAEALVNATAAGLFAASELAGGEHHKGARRFPHRRLVEMLNESAALSNYFALLDVVLSHQGDIPSAVWLESAWENIEAVVKALSGAALLQGDVADFLAGPQPQAIGEVEEAAFARTENIFAYPPDEPQVRIRLGSIHSVKGETHTATLVLDSFYHGHHLGELKPWLLGTKSGGSSMNHRGRQVLEGPRMLGRLKLHYVAMTRPTHLLCLAMRKDAFNEVELQMLADRGWTIIDCCIPAQL